MNIDTHQKDSAVILSHLVNGGAKALKANLQQINALNVFPVPDGDTGTNMSLTFEAASDYIKDYEGKNVTVLAENIARAVLLGARGNSGLILSQFFKGVNEAIQATETLDAITLAKGILIGTEAASRAMPNPKEGTILTVMREAGLGAEEKAKAGGTLEEVLEAAIVRGTEAVKHTPEQLDVLKEAGVVDAGGFGLVIALQGWMSLWKGEDPEAVRLELEGVRFDALNVSSHFLEKLEDDWGYCTVFAIIGENLNVNDIKEEVNSMGRSAVVAGENTMVKVHVHVDDPGKVLSAGVSRGSLTSIEISNMDQQVHTWSEGHRKEASQKERFNTAIVAVVMGKGMKAAFESAGLGAVTIVSGGDTLNPSAQDISEAVEVAPSENVIILPNSRNVAGVANLIPEISSKNISIVYSDSMQAGIAALLAFLPEEDLKTNQESMASALKNIKSGSVFRSTKDSNVGGLDIQLDHFVGMLEDKPVTTAKTARLALMKALADIAEDGALVTIYYGKNVDDNEAEEISEDIHQRIEGVEVEILNGGQPNYDFIFTIE